MICDRRSRINSKTLTLLLLRNYYHFTITTTPLLWPLHYYDHSPILTTPLLRPLHHYHNCIIMTTPLLWPLAYYKHCAITTTSVISTTISWYKMVSNNSSMVVRSKITIVQLIYYCHQSLELGTNCSRIRRVLLYCQQNKYGTTK